MSRVGWFLFVVAATAASWVALGAVAKVVAVLFMLGWDVLPWMS